LNYVLFILWRSNFISDKFQKTAKWGRASGYWGVGGYGGYIKRVLDQL